MEQRDGELWCAVLSLSTINTKELRGRPSNVLQKFQKPTQASEVINNPVYKLALYARKNSHFCEKRNLLTDYSSQHVTGILGNGELYSEEEKEQV